MSDDWHRAEHPYRASVPARAKAAIKAQRDAGDFEGGIVIVEGEGKLLHVDCANETDRTVIVCEHDEDDNSH